MPLSFFPLIAIGGYLSSALAKMLAPICLRGSITLAIGLCFKESSPVSTEKNGLPARMPDMSLMVVPELPQLITSSGSLKPYNPLPLIMSTLGEPSVISRPSALNALIVLNGSSAISRFLTTLLPLAIDANMTALCEMDLSGGGIISPFNPLILVSS